MENKVPQCSKVIVNPMVFAKTQRIYYAGGLGLLAESRR